MKTIGEILKSNPLFTPISTAQKTCAKHGIEYTETVYPRFTKGCPECAKECDEERKAAEQAEREAAQQRFLQQQLEKRVGKSRIPLRFQNKTIREYRVDNAQQAAVVESVKAYAREFAGKHSGRSLALLGNAGTGKTHLACAVGNHVIKNCGGMARFLSVSELNRLVRQAKSFDSEISESEVIAALSKYDLLIIDEVGVQSGTEAESRALFDVFNERYQNMKPTIFISNLGAADFVAAVGDRIVDRIKEDGGEVLFFNWQSERGRDAA